MPSIIQSSSFSLHSLSKKTRIETEGLLAPNTAEPSYCIHCPKKQGLKLEIDTVLPATVLKLHSLSKKTRIETGFCTAITTPHTSSHCIHCPKKQGLKLSSDASTSVAHPIAFTVQKNKD